jgi:hypothetical protein
MMCCRKSNLVQAQDNNANEVHVMAYMLWDVYGSYESKRFELECET